MNNTIEQEQYIQIVHDTIQQRRSVGVLTEPAPTQQQLLHALQSAWFAPDHRRLKPTRFVVIETEQRQAFAEVLVQAFLHDNQADETFEPAQQQKIRQQVLRAPLLVLALTKIQQHEKVPAFEQLLSTGSAVQNVLLSLQAQGFASMWRTGHLVESTYLKQALGLTAEDYISGILYIGSASRELPVRDDTIDEHFIRYWTAD